jgi:uncharacterized membrane protein SpoIIM required for sporulation
MTETQFIEQNKEDWKKLEAAIKNKSNDPDELNTLFRKVSSHLAYAQTYFPRRSVKVYLNNLVNQVFDSMRTSRKIRLWAAIKNFYNEVLPREIVQHKKSFIAAFLIFFIATLVGVYSTIEENSFTRTILGDHYVELTESNIKNGDPMAIYKSHTQIDSFLGITINNIRVAFFTFILGLIASLGTFVILVHNGIMLGTFQTMFFTKGLLLKSALVIWIHGTIEISVIIIAGAAGLVMGNSLLFPGTYKRFQSLQQGAISASYIMLSTIPFFVVAGFLESFVTRYTDMPNVIKVAIIFVSLSLILFTYVVKPYLYKKSGKFDNYSAPEISINFMDEKNTKGKTLKSAFLSYRIHLETVLLKFILPFTAMSAFMFYFIIKHETINLEMNNFDFMQYTDGKLPMMFFMFFAYLYFFSMMHQILNNESVTVATIIKGIFKHFVGYVFAAFMALICFHVGDWWHYVIFLIIPFSIPILATMYLEDESSDISAIGAAISLSFKSWTSILGINIAVFGVYLILYFASYSLLNLFLGEVLLWSDFGINKVMQQLLLVSIFKYFILTLCLPLFYFIFKHKYEILVDDKYSYDLVDKVASFGNTIKN